MENIKLGIIKEGKNPPDKRVPLTPQQCVEIEKQYPHVKVVVQTSNIRAFKDDEYSKLGIEIVKDLSDCDIIMGVKEVNPEDLIPNKKFIFFSHTFKKQPYNRGLLKAILDKKIQLIDYEVMKNESGKRLIGFGRYAGIVGCYNGLLAYGKKHDLYKLKPANQCFDRKEMEEELKKVDLPKNTKIVLTGKGRVGNGALEVLSLINIERVSCKDLMEKEFDLPTYAVLGVKEYNQRKDGNAFSLSDFYAQPEKYASTFPRLLDKIDMYIPCHYWDSKAPYIFTREDLKKENLRLSVVADISCDIDGPVASTIRPSTIADPLYGYDPQGEKEIDFMDSNAIGVMAVDNLPCELPRDASEDFGNELIKNIFPALLGNQDPEKIIDRASETTLDGKLNVPFQYLEEYVTLG